ncbi:GW domain-containing glycosaminoglycan-binding protein [Carnobacterium inhibens]|uniref:GW domain-containing glycosaminoglycan-binding protein n=1 Tax=Carnobacterium inhibens TaxID=147709 RepID=UPI0005539184|nr:GW domain-containing glycosaminoglycan-binding protein [Carnobacterium inhibens]
MKKSYKAALVLSIVGIGVIGLYQPTDTVEAALDYSILQRSTYPKVNTYIKQQNLWIPKITQQVTQFPKFDYRNGNGQAEGIVIHETANKNSTIAGEIAYMKQNYENAFVHAFVDKDNIIQIHPADYAVWGAGKQANPRFYQIELVEHNTFHQFAQSVNNDAFLIANMLHYFDLAPSRATKEGSGTVWTHDEVSRYLGGTNHTDPVGYFAQWGYTVAEFYSLIVEKYNAMPNQVYQEEDMVGAYALPVDPHNYGVWSSAINGTKVTNLSNYSNQYIYIQKRVRTNAGDWYLIGKDGKDIGWVSADGVQLSSISSTPDKDAYNYGVWSNYIGGTRVAGLSSYSGKTIEVTNEKYVNGSPWVQFAVDGKVIGWVAKDGVAIGSKPQEVPQPVDLTGMPVANAYNYGIWTDYNGGSLVNGLNVYSDQIVNIVSTVKDANGNEKIQIAVNGKAIGWVAKEAVDTNIRPVNYAGIATTDAYNYGVWSNYTGSNNKRVGSLNDYVNKQLTITKEATLPDGSKWVEFSVDGKVIGWVGEKGIDTSIIPVNYIAMPVTDAYNYGVWSSYTGSNNKRVGSLNDYVNKQLTITKEATLPDGSKWVEFSVDGKVIGWVGEKGIDTSIIPVNYTAMPVADAYNYGVWSNYTGSNNKRVGSLNDYVNKQLTITKEATLPDGSKWVEFSVDGKVIGWVGEKGIDTNIIPVNYTAMPVTDAYNYGVWSSYTGSNNKRVGSLNDYVNKQLTITKEATLPDGSKWVEFSVNGKVIGWVGQKGITLNKAKAAMMPIQEKTETADVVTVENINGTPVAESSDYGIWDSYQPDSTKVGELSFYTNKIVTVTQKAIFEDGKEWFEISVNGNIIGWVSKTGIDIVDNTENQTSEETVVESETQELIEPEDTEASTVITGVPVKEADQFEIKDGYSDDSNVIGELADYISEEFVVTQKVKLKDQTEWFEITLDNKSIGWVQSEALEIK